MGTSGPKYKLLLGSMSLLGTSTQVTQIQGLGNSRPGRKQKLVLSAHDQIGSEKTAIISGWCIREAMGTGLKVGR